MTKLLTISNPKTQKSRDHGYLTAIMHLAPERVAGRGNVCPWASDGCKKACLNTAGAALWAKGKEKARNWRTRLYFDDRAAFYTQLIKEIAAFERKAKREGLKAAIRLNGTSDLKFRKSVFSAFPDIQFYDYTKGFNVKPSAVNHHLTYSRSENTTLAQIKRLVVKGKNVAVVFDKALPAMFEGMRVVSGLHHDLRFTDPQGVIVGLKALGKARQDKSGFVVNTVFCDDWLENPTC